MSVPLDALRSRYDRIAISTIHLAFALSLVLHALLLAGWIPKIHLLPFDESELKKPGHSLAVRLVPMPDSAPPPAPAIPAHPPPAQRLRPLLPAKQRPSAQPVLAIERPSNSPAAPPAEAARPPANQDFASLIEARRRAREAEAAPPPSQASAPAQEESEQQRRNRIVAANLGLDRAPTFGADKRHGGGIFELRRVGYESAEFVFFGWNKFIKRNTNQVIEVRRGTNPSVELAVVRKMIEIIREHEQGNFTWESHRLGRDVNLSARLSDTAGLEDFLLQEFFSGARPRN